MINFRPATAKDALEFYGKPATNSFKGIVAIKNKKVVGIGGIFYMKGGVVAFSEMKDELRESKKDIVRGCRMLVDIIKLETRPVYAIADPNEPTARKLLKKLGFISTGMIGVEGETLIWQEK